MGFKEIFSQSSRPCSPSVDLLGDDGCRFHFPMLPLMAASPVLYEAAPSCCHGGVSIRLCGWSSEVIRNFLCYVVGDQVSVDDVQFEDLQGLCQVLAVPFDFKRSTIETVEKKDPLAIDTGIVAKEEPVEMVGPDSAHETATVRFLSKTLTESFDSDAIQESPAREGQFQCTTCGKSFETSVFLIEHICSTSESSSTVQLNFECPFQCTVCKQRFPLRWKLRRHVERHCNSEKRSCECPTCHISFVNIHQLNRHRCRAAAPNSKLHSCGTCGKTFKFKSILARHEVKHTDERPYPCPTCGKRFKHLGDAVTHMGIHPDETTIKCDICKKECCNQGALYDHVTQNHPSA